MLYLQMVCKSYQSHMVSGSVYQDFEEILLVPVKLVNKLVCVFVFDIKAWISFRKPHIMRYVCIVWMVLFSVYNNTSCRCIYHEVGTIWSIIQFLSGESDIYDVESNFPNFWCDCNLVLTHAIRSMEHHHPTYF